MDELLHHGYKLSADTIYPILHAMEKEGFLTSSEDLVERRVRRTHLATTEGLQKKKMIAPDWAETA